MVLVVVGIQFLHPRFVNNVYAQPGGGTTILADIPRQVASTLEEVGDSLLQAGMGALLNGVSYFARKIAYDTASYIADGGKGQSALIFKDGVDDYLKNVAADTAAEAISSLGEPFGLNLCQIPNPKINAYLQIGLHGLYVDDKNAPQPRCSWQNLRDNWGNIGSVLEERYGPGGSRFVAETFNASVSVSQSDFGVALGAVGQVDQVQESAKFAKSLERQIGGGLKDVTSAISGRVLSPAELLKEDLKLLSAKEQQDLTSEQIAGIYGAELKNIPAFAANVFLSTLSSKLLNEVFTGIFPDTPDPGSPGASGITSFYAQQLQDNRRGAQKALSFLLTPRINQISNYNIVEDFASCPDTPGLNNCVIDDSFQQALQRSSQGQALTIREAITEGLLHADWPLISPRRERDNQDIQNCYLNKYCYSNIQKLRKARVLPLGFELAALKSDPDQPWTLGQVVDGFDRCNSQGASDRQNPFCHMIDPNWIIKIPQARCQSKQYGPILFDAGTPVRQEECMDLQTCVLEGDDGTCQSWGYCTQEKNIWRLDGEKCEKHYATCTTFRNTTDNTSVTYLSRTVDFGECDEDSIGCRAYSTEQVNGNWVTNIQPNLTLKALGRSEFVHLNQNVETCSEDSEGCTAFYRAQRDDNSNYVLDASGNYQKDGGDIIGLKKAPDYLGCYDINRGPTEPEPNTTQNSPVIDWPQTLNEVLNTLPTNPQCDNYAQACAPAEVGCELYTPTDGSDALPGIASNQDRCDSACVGYDTFKQEASDFEAARFPLHFIPPTDPASQCIIDHVGCDEFTNLEAATTGGEARQYFSSVRYCEKPTGNNEGTFFSWEGSDTEGYVLKTHNLLIIDNNKFSYIQSLAGNTGANQLVFGAGENATTVFPVGSPAYNNDTKDDLQNSYNTCNATNYNILINNPFAINAASADCRALYDSAGNIFYRLLTDTVSVSDQCTRFRKTDSRLFVDQAITQSIRNQVSAVNLCQDQGGLWGDVDGDNQPECQRCFGGGTYTNGVCVYQTIPGESTQCPAAANGCRAYTGNTGNNLNPRVVYDVFDTTTTSASGLNLAKAGWTLDPNVTISAESLQVGGRSLQVDINTLERTIDAGTIRSGEWYELSFWSIGTLQNLTISFTQDADGNGTIDPNTETFGIFTIDNTTQNITPLTVGGSWQQYKLGPVQFTGSNSNPVVLRFDRSAVPGRQLSGSYYLDFVRLGQLEDRSYFIRNSWQRTATVNGQQVIIDAPLFCDANPTDNFPGAALGCQAYTDSSGSTSFLTGFSGLCREEAIGCQPLYESHNTIDDENAKLYNAWCDPTFGNIVGNRCEIRALNSQNELLGNCSIEVGETGCFVQEISLPDGLIFTADVLTTNVPLASVVTSSIYILPEPNTPIFLSPRNADGQSVECRENELGCIKVGRQEQVLPGTNQAYEYTDMYIINNPAKYSDQLCSSEQIACTEYVAGANRVYFKDPKLTGNTTCSYKTNVSFGGNTFSGWFQDNVGVCNSDQTLSCKQDTDCGAGGTCVNIGVTPCYANNLQAGNEYGIWSSDTPGAYQGFVGTCPVEQNLCTEFIDRFDTAPAYPNGRAYYRINDNRLTDSAAECNGQVSLKEGCILFDETSRPNKLYNASATYAASDVAVPRYGLVPPVPATGNTTNDSNVILKVERDRACSEWLACRTEVLFKQDDGTEVRLCSQYKACDATEPGKECSNFIDPPLENRFLDERKYTSRDVSWFGFDYTGYSILDRYPISDLISLSFANDDNKYLAYQADDRLFVAGDPTDPTAANFQAAGCLPDPTLPTAQRQDRDGQACGFDGLGRCLKEKCIYPVEGPANKQFDPIVQPPATPSQLDLQNTLLQNIEVIKQGITGPTCKGFPESDSPFPEFLAGDYPAGTDVWSTPRKEGDLLLTGVCSDTVNSPTPQSCHADSDCNVGAGATCVPTKVRRTFSSVNSGFTGANLCQDGNCSCSYFKYIYDNAVTDYYATSIQDIVPDGVCSGGELDGYACAIDRDCNTYNGAATPQNLRSSGTCSRLTRKETHVGLTGFCLEYDYSRPINGFVAPGSGRDQEYACLTWLPIQTAASKVDLLNRFQEAGYYPVPGFDAPISDSGGEVMCLSTDRGGYYDANDFPATFNELEVNAFFTSGFRTSPIINTIYSTAFSFYGRSGIRGGSPPQVPLRRAVCPREEGYPGYPSNDPNHPNNGNYPTNGIMTVRTVDDIFTVRNRGEWYRAAFCRPSANPPATNQNARRQLSYQIMQTWAWENISRAATVATVEGTGYISPILHTGAQTQFTVDNINSVHLVPVLYEADDYQNITGDSNIQTVFPTFLEDGYEIDFNLLQNQGVDRNAVFGTIYNRGDFTNFLVRLDPRAGNIYTVCPPGETSTNGFNTGCAGHNAGSTAVASQWTYRQDTNLPAGVSERYAWVFVPNTFNPNNIQGRNVTIGISEPGWVQNTANFTAEPGSAANNSVAGDPFSSANLTACDGSIGWAFDFDINGNLINIVRKACNRAGYRTYMAIIPEFNAQCVELAQVYDAGANPLSETTNKAWTNRVWSNAQRVAGSVLTHPLRDYGMNGANIAFGRDLSMRPFGSLPLSGTLLNSLSSNTSVASLIGHSFNQISAAGVGDGVPYSCLDTVYPVGSSILISSGSGACAFPSGSPYRSFQFVMNVIESNLVATARDAVAELFARFSTTRLNSTRNGYSPLATTDRSGNYSQARIIRSNPIATNAASTGSTEDLIVPQIYSLNPATCLNAIGTCTAAEPNAMSINGRNSVVPLKDYDGDGSFEEDANLDGQVDLFLGRGSFSATLNFFAFADDNRMPIRNVIVDWGDGLVTNDNPTNPSGLYKNRKPYCDNSNTLSPPSVGLCNTPNGPSGLTCERDADCPAELMGNTPGDICLTARDASGAPGLLNLRTDRYSAPRFGNAPRACVPEPFEFIHTYLCQQSVVDAAAANPSAANSFARQVHTLDPAMQDRLIVQGVGPDDFVCVYKPKVQVRDNWGYCNGVCGGASSPGGTQCYGVGSGLTRECNYSNGIAQNNPWTEYIGEIIVIPGS